MIMNEIFRHIAKKVSEWAGSAWTFVLALTIIVGWWFSGPLFQFSDTWQLVINTGTTIITFLMVFLIQNTQNRESKAVNLKLDELIRSIRSANNTLIDVEELSDEELIKLEQIYIKISHEKHRRSQKKEASQK